MNADRANRGIADESKATASLVSTASQENVPQLQATLGCRHSSTGAQVGKGFGAHLNIAGRENSSTRAIRTKFLKKINKYK